MLCYSHRTKSCLADGTLPNPGWLLSLQFLFVCLLLFVDVVVSCTEPTLADDTLSNPGWLLPLQVVPDPVSGKGEDADDVENGKGGDDGSKASKGFHSNKPVIVYLYFCIFVFAYQRIQCIHPNIPIPKNLLSRSSACSFNLDTWSSECEMCAFGKNRFAALTI